MSTEKKASRKPNPFKMRPRFELEEVGRIFLPYHKNVSYSDSRLFNFILTLLFCFDRRRRGSYARGPFSSRRDTEKRSKTKTMNCFIIIIIECTLAPKKDALCVSEMFTQIPDK